MEPCTIIVNARDRFSTLERCLETLIANTPELGEVIVIIGGAPETLRHRWTQRFGTRMRFLFQPHFLNQAQARNIALRQVTTRLAVVMDDDVFVRPGWLSPLIDCQQQTGAVMVVPNILEAERTIHTAGNELYVTYVNGKAYGHKELRFHSMPFVEGCNLKRQRTGYGELHCQLVEVEPSLRLGVFDEHIQEVGEVDFGLTCRKAGREMWFEPASVVYYAIRSPLHAEDIRLFAWRWDMRAIYEGYQYFERKWNMDITESGSFREFLLRYNSQLGLIPRLMPTELGLRIDRMLARLRRWPDILLRLLRAPKSLLRRYKAWCIGYYVWPEPSAE